MSQDFTDKIVLLLGILCLQIRGIQCMQVNLNLMVTSTTIDVPLATSLAILMIEVVAVVNLQRSESVKVRLNVARQIEIMNNMIKVPMKTHLQITKLEETNKFQASFLCCFHTNVQQSPFSFSIFTRLM